MKFLELAALFIFLSAIPAYSSPIQPSQSTIMNRDDNLFNITGGERAGENLFHSFQEFNLDSRQIANFLSSPDIHNIFARIVGSNPSFIDGLIQVTGSNSNFYLMNPAGLIFGSNASLNVPGDFFATTATSIGFNEGNFNAFGTNDYANLTGNPLTFKFDVNNPASIVNAGNLSVDTGRDLGLVGGSVINTGMLSAPGGNITIAAVPGTSRVKISQPGAILTLEPDVPTSENGDLLSFTPLDLPALLVGAGLPDDMAQNPGTAFASGEIITRNEAREHTGGNIAILGSRVLLHDALIDASGSSGGGNIFIGGDYQGKGDLLRASQTVISAGTRIHTDAIADGNGGTAIVWSNNLTEFEGYISARGGASSGDGGFIEVSGKQQLFFNGLTDTSAVFGLNGTLLLDPQDITIGAISPADFFGITGDTYDASPLPLFFLVIETGNIIVQADRHIVVNTPTPLNLTNAASVTFIADADGDGIGGFFAANDILANGNIAIAAATIDIQSLTSEAQLNLTTTGGDILFENTIARGETTLTSAGNIRGQVIFTRGGNATLTGRDIQIRDIRTSAAGLDGGGVEIAANNVEVGTISTNGTGLGLNGGDVEILAHEDVAIGDIETFGHNAGDLWIEALGGEVNILNRFLAPGVASGGDARVNARRIGTASLTVTATGINGRAGRIFFQADEIETSTIIGTAPFGLGSHVEMLAANSIQTGEIYTDGQVPGFALLQSDRIQTESIWGNADLTGDRIHIDGVLDGANLRLHAQSFLAIAGQQDYHIQNNTLISQSASIIARGNLDIIGPDFFIGDGSGGAISESGTSAPILSLTPSGTFEVFDTDLLDTTTRGLIAGTLNYTNIGTASPTPAIPTTTVPTPIATVGSAANTAQQLANIAGETLTISNTSDAMVIAIGDASLYLSLSSLITKQSQDIAPQLATNDQQLVTEGTQPNIAAIENQLILEFERYFERELPIEREFNLDNLKKALEGIAAKTGRNSAILYAITSDRAFLIWSANQHK